MSTNSGYLGICHTNYPNFYWLLGPGTGLGTNSIIFMIECQVGFPFASFWLLGYMNYKQEKEEMDQS